MKTKNYLTRKMGMAAALLLPMFALVFASSAMASDILAEFNGGIGVIPVSSGGPPVVVNAVQGIQPAGDPWRIGALKAEITKDGKIHVEGHHLLLAGGSGIGTNGGQKVFVSLISGTTVSSTPTANAVALADDGNFTINDVLSPAPSSMLQSPILLIRNEAGVWFAAGIPVVKQ
jgi:hypothetical protein